MNARTKTLSILISLAVGTALTLSSIPSANSVTISKSAVKTITCYKAKLVKKVSASKCPSGWSTKKPVTPTPTPTATKPAPTPTKGASTFALNATYKGKMSILWSESDVKANSVTLVGSGTDLGLDSLTGTGFAAPSNQCDSIDGSGVLGSGADTIKVSFDPTAKGCAADSDAPTVITVSGNATVLSGTGKYAGASGTLKVAGSFAIKSKDAGFSESTTLTLTISGTITTK